MCRPKKKPASFNFVYLCIVITTTSWALFSYSRNKGNEHLTVLLMLKSNTLWETWWKAQVCGCVLWDMTTEGDETQQWVCRCDLDANADHISQHPLSAYMMQHSTRSGKLQLVLRREHPWTSVKSDTSTPPMVEQPQKHPHTFQSWSNISL